ncbi:MAG TPA: hypothetical protein PKK23_18575 [Nitrospirales bacterium]|nr:hypothetical protein [Nitrospirales bacterium]
MVLRKGISACDWSHTAIRAVCGVLLVLLLELPVLANGKESTTTKGESESNVHQPAKADSDSTISDVMGWARRFGKRVGENFSEAAGKTATAIKKATSDKKPKSPSEDSP